LPGFVDEYLEAGADLESGEPARAWGAKMGPGWCRWDVFHFPPHEAHIFQDGVMQTFPKT
jgi:hypothetical protein